MANSKGSGGNFISGEKTVSAAGTREAVQEKSDGSFWKGVVLIAKANNVGQVFIGGPDVDSSTNDGLAAGEALPMRSGKGIDLATTFLDVSVSGEGVDFYGVV